jgi:hypothetical protein
MGTGSSQNLLFSVVELRGEFRMRGWAPNQLQIWTAECSLVYHDEMHTLIDARSIEEIFSYPYLRLLISRRVPSSWNVC